MTTNDLLDCWGRDLLLKEVVVSGREDCEYESDVLRWLKWNQDGVVLTEEKLHKLGSSHELSYILPFLVAIDEALPLIIYIYLYQLLEVFPEETFYHPAIVTLSLFLISARFPVMWNLLTLDQRVLLKKILSDYADALIKFSCMEDTRGENSDFQKLSSFFGRILTQKVEDPWD